MLSEPVKVDFGREGNAELDTLVYDKLTALKSKLKSLHETKVDEWRKAYKGIPKDESKSFPWENASNLVVQVIGMHTDTLRARVLGSIFNIMPLYACEIVGEWGEEEHASEQREVVEQFMNYVGLEPTELDLYRVLSNGFGETIKFGNCVWKAPWESDQEIEVIGSGSSNKRYETEFMKYDGPKPEKLAYEDFLIDPTANTLEQGDFKAHRRRLNKFELLERKHRGLYDKAAIEKILLSPDRIGSIKTETEQLQDSGIQSTTHASIDAEWDIYECHLNFWHNKRKYSIIYTYHYATKTKLKSIFNFYPKNLQIFESARLGYDGDDGFYGYGFCEMLRHYQNEISTIHNQRVDNNTLANTSIIRISKNSKLDSIFSLYPNAVIPAEDGEFDVHPLGRAAPESVDYENLTLNLAKDRSGVGPASTGGGSGVQNPKRGIYSAMGTFAVMQEANSRVAVNTTDMRYAHIKLGRMFLQMYAEFGVGSRAKLFGKNEPYLRKALDNIKNGRLILPVRAASASINKELEKQNDMLLTNVLKQHYQGVGQVLQAIQNPQMPEDMKEYLVATIKGSQQMMGRILRNFGHDDTSRMLPEPSIIKSKGNGNGQQPTGSPSQQPVAAGNGEEGSNTQNIPGRGMAGDKAVLPINSGIPSTGVSTQ